MQSDGHRRGRRPGRSDSRADILRASRQLFATFGYERTTIRGIAREAAVDPALVHHFFGTKDRLFEVSLQLPVNLAEAIPALVGPGLDGLGERLTRFYLSLWESESAAAMLTVLRTAVSQDRAAALLRRFVGREVIGKLATELNQPNPQLRAALVGSQLVGVAMVRYVVQVEPLASVSREQVVAAVSPTVQRYLAGDLGQL
jgi:AcrR family transcriptional regulator